MVQFLYVTFPREFSDSSLALDLHVWTLKSVMLVFVHKIYRAKVSDAATADGSTAGWFKISENGLPSSNPDYWGTGVYSANLKFQKR